jgi:Fic family protein
VGVTFTGRLLHYFKAGCHCGATYFVASLPNLLLQAGYAYVPYVSHEKIVEDNKPEYYLSLRQSQRTFQTDQDTILPWLTFFLDILLVPARMALDLLSGENIEKLLSPRQLDVWRYMQAAREATPKQLSAELGIPRPTINQVLNRLLELNRIERIGFGRATRYRVK